MKVRTLIKKLLNYNLDADIEIQDGSLFKRDIRISYVTDGQHRKKENCKRVLLSIKYD